MVTPEYPITEELYSLLVRQYHNLPMSLREPIKDITDYYERCQGILATNLLEEARSYFHPGLTRGPTNLMRKYEAVRTAAETPAIKEHLLKKQNLASKATYYAISNGAKLLRMACDNIPFIEALTLLEKEVTNGQV